MLDEKLEPVAIETRFNVRRKTNSDSKNLCLSLQNTGSTFISNVFVNF